MSTRDFTVGMSVAGRPQAVTVEAEDALAAALMVKDANPEATINYVRKRNDRGDRRHPHRRLSPAEDRVG
jgi:hypothetical protein